MELAEKLHKLTLETLAKMDGGRIGAAFQLALKRAIEDAEERPQVRKAREIIIKLGIVPVAGPEDETCDQIAMQAVVSDTVPKRQTRVYSARVKHGGVAAFNDESLDNIDQLTLGLEDSED
jgi:hypothetical protein